MTYEELVALKNTVNQIGIILPYGDVRFIIAAVENGIIDGDLEAYKKIALVWNELPRVFEEIFRLNEDHNRLTNAIASIHDKSTEVLQNTSRGMVAEDYWQALDD